MSRRAPLLALLALLISVPATYAQDGLLQRVREQVRAPDDAPARPDSSGSGSCDDDFLSPILGALFEPLCWEMLGAPFVLPARLLGDDWGHHFLFAPHPHSQGYSGYLMRSRFEASADHAAISEDMPQQFWAGRLSLENGNDFSGLNRLGGQLRLESSYRIGLVTNWNYFRERLDNGRHDELVIGDANLIVRFAQNEVASFYTGAGARVLTDRCGSDCGFNFTYGGDWFPVRPLVVSGVIDLGTLGGAFVFHGRATVGATVSACEVFGGYDFLRIGSVNLQGPLVSVRWWF
jgi:hypothetical protein